MRVTPDVPAAGPGGSAATAAAEPLGADAGGDKDKSDDAELIVVTGEPDDEEMAESDDGAVIGAGGGAAVTSRGVSADAVDCGAASTGGADTSTVGVGGGVGFGGVATSVGFARGFALTTGRGGVTGCDGTGVGGVGSLTTISVTMRPARGGCVDAGTRLSAP